MKQPETRRTNTQHLLKKGVKGTERNLVTVHHIYARAQDIQRQELNRQLVIFCQVKQP